MKTWKRPSVVLAFLGMVAVCGWLVRRLGPEPSLQEVGERSTSCMVSGNSDCVYEPIMERERVALGLNRAKLKALLEGYILPAYRSKFGEPKKDTLALDDQGQVQVSWTWPNAKRGTMTVATIVVATPEGARTICTTQWMIYNAMEAMYRKSPNEEKLLVYLDGLEHDSARLTQLGIKGIYDPKKDLVVEWPELIDRYRKSASQMGWLGKN